MKSDHKYVGYWSLTDEHGNGLHILKKQRPPWIHRFMNQLFFGNKWYDLNVRYK
jgi:hypothetical protein